MKIVKHSYQATITPQAFGPESLWQYVIRREGSAEILASRDTATKEDAHSLALLEISQLVRNSGTSDYSKRRIS